MTLVLDKGKDLKQTDKEKAEKQIKDENVLSKKSHGKKNRKK